jgi:hypothetical protein
VKSHETTPWGTARTRFGRGPLATERLLLEDVDAILGALGEAALGFPLVIVVPSRALRLHVLDRLLSHRDSALAGVECQTHYRLAARLVEDETGRRPGTIDLSQILARRMARDEPALVRTLEDLDDGYRTVLPAVTDLLDAGLDPAHREALEDALEEDGRRVAGTSDVARAQAVVRVAVRTAAAMLELGLERPSTILAQAAWTVASMRTAPWSAVLVYGYSDATGVATDFLLTLLERCGGCAYLDLPPDPAHPSKTDSGIEFSRRFTERVTASAPPTEETEESEDPQIDMYRAAGSDAEVREAARRIRALIDQGVAPERIGLVARSLEPYRHPIRIQFGRLAVPFSSVGAKGSLTPAGYRVDAILELMRLGGRAPLERWLDARSTATLPARDFDLRLAFHSLGAGRLEDAAELDPSHVTDDGYLKLPFSSQLTAPAAGGPNDEPAPARTRFRQLEQTALEDESSRCNRALALLGTRGPQTVVAHLSALETLLAIELAAGSDDEQIASLLDRAQRALRDLPGDFVLEHRELEELLRTAWSPVGESPLGGAGGGVRVLEVMEARSSTFDYLFVLGLNRNRFPRVVHVDPLLSDDLRRVLGRRGHGVLPDLPRKLDGRSEERFLFAQLLAASPRVTVSWQDVDDDGAFTAPSTFIERLRWSTTGTAPWTDPPRIEGVLAGPPAAHPELRPALESAILAGLAVRDDRTRFCETLEVALQESEASAVTGQNPASIARIRTRFLDEIDPLRTSAEGRRRFRRLGPLLGLIGAPDATGDPRLAPEIWVTTLESLARCPWQTLLQRILRIEPAPDPIGELPSIDQRLLGNVVHNVLDGIVTDEVGAAPKRLADAVDRPGVRIPWPSEDDLQRRLHRAARHVLQREGIAIPGFERVLVRIAEPFLDAARTMDWPAGASREPIIAAELKGRVPNLLRSVTVAFRADRLDRGSDGLVFTDYKTGKRLFGSSRTSLAPNQLLKAIASGSALQAMAYALARTSDAGRGRYLFLHPELDEARGREALLASDDSNAGSVFRATGEALLDLWLIGTLFPRLVKPDRNEEPEACSYCDVAEACLRGDSGARSRLRNWAAKAGEEAPDRRDPTDAAALAVWSLPLSTGASR